MGPRIRMGGGVTPRARRAWISCGSQRDDATFADALPRCAMIDVRAPIRQTGQARFSNGLTVRPGSAALCCRAFALILLACAGLVRAGGLYTAQVPVATQSDSDRAEGLKM